MTSSPFLNDIRRFMRTRGYSIRTEKTYVYWIRFFIRYQKLQHPKDMGAAEVVQFLGFLANDRHVSVNTQKLALNALAFLYNTYLELPLGDLGFQHANKPARLPVVISSQEVGRILAVMNNRDRLIFSLLFGSGLRISECLRLRIKDFDFSRRALTVHSGKGDKDRVTILSPSLKADIEAAMASAVEIQKMDNAQGVGPSLPEALGRKASRRSRYQNLAGITWAF